MTTPTVAIVGSGFSGIAVAIALRRAGIDSYTVYERGHELGGVWARNTYPGAACDVPSYLYSYSFAKRRDWSQPCSPQQEIKRYLEECARREDVDRHVRFGAEVTAAAFDDETLRWTLSLSDGTTAEADVLVPACGQLSRPAFPRIPGMETFAGRAFHSAEWDHAHDLTGRRVAVVGTGASAVQFVPPVAEQAAHVDVFQRSPSYMLPRRNRRYRPAVRAAIAHVPGLQAIRRAGMWMVMEGFITGLRHAPPLKAVLRAWSWAHLRASVRDRALRRKLTPDYPFGCKRILFSSSYYEALQRPNVALRTETVAEIVPSGVRTADGVVHPADTIVYGTGFRANDFVAPMEVRGSGGRTLAEAWEDGARAHLGITVPGFPNMFLMYGPNTNLGVGSIVAMIEAQAGYAIDAIGLLRDTAAAALDVRPEVADASDARMQETLRESVWSSCDSWYRDDTGRVVNNWPGYMLEYVRATRTANPAEFATLRRATADRR